MADRHSTAADLAAPDVAVEIATRSDVSAATSAVRRLARDLELSKIDATRVLTATLELVNNVLNHSGSVGLLRAWKVRREGKTGIEIVVSDGGCGIADVDWALTDGNTTGSGLGVGLPGTRRLADDFEIETAPGKGTSVRIVFWRLR